MAFSISNISLRNCYSKSFTTNSYFPLTTQQFCSTDVFLYTAIYVVGNFAALVKISVLLIQLNNKSFYHIENSSNCDFSPIHQIQMPPIIPTTQHISKTQLYINTYSRCTYVCICTLPHNNKAYQETVSTLEPI